MEPESGMPVMLIVFTLFMLTLMQAFLVLSQSAIFNADTIILRKMAENRNKRSLRILKMISEPRITTMHLSLSVALAFSIYAVTYQAFSPHLIKLLQNAAPLPPFLLSALSVVIIFALLFPFYLFFGILVPRRIGIFRADRIASQICGAYHGIYVLLFPITWVLHAATIQLCRVAGVLPNARKQDVTEERILTMVNRGEQTGAILKNEKTLISKVFEFNDTTAYDIATHRTDLLAVEDTATLYETAQLAQQKGYSRIPVYHEDLDNIIGVVYVKDLLRYVGKHMNNATPVTEMMRTPYFIPESMQCSQLFTELTERKMQIAVVIDEYGGTAGIVTMEDLLEAIVGNMQDEYDAEEQEIEKLSDTTYRIQGVTAIETVNDALGLALPSQEQDTIGGFVVMLLGHLPFEGERPVIAFENLLFTVEKMKDNRIGSLLLEMQA